MNQYFTKIKTLSANTAIRGTAIVTISFFVVNILSYLLQLYLGRTMSLAEYGAFNALLSLFYIVGFPNNVINTSLIKLTSGLKGKEMFDELTTLFVKFTSFGVIYFFIVVLVLYILRVPLADYLNIENEQLFFALGIFTGFSALLIIPSAYLQGLLRFKAFAFFLVFGGMMRLLFPIGLVNLGYGVAGVFIGFTIGMFINFNVATLLLKKNFTKVVKKDLRPYYKKVLLFSIPVLLVNFGMLLLNNIDIILVKHTFDPDTAGIYAGLVTMGKILLFGAGSVGVVMFPQISELHSKGADFRPKFKEFVVLQLILILGGIVAFNFFPQLIATILFGDNFLVAVQYLPRHSIFIGLYVFINFMILFFLAIEKTNIWMLLVPVILMQFILLNLFSTDLGNVVNINIFVSIVLLLGVMMYYWKYVGFGNSSRI